MRELGGDRPTREDRQRILRRAARRRTVNGHRERNVTRNVQQFVLELDVAYDGMDVLPVDELFGILVQFDLKPAAQSKDG